MQSATFIQIQTVVTQITRQFSLVNSSETPTSGRPRKIPQIDAITFALYQHTSTRATKKSVYLDFKDELGCSYKTFVVSVNAAMEISVRILFLIMMINKHHQHLIKYTDATDIPVCLKKNADSHKTMAAFAQLGRSTKGWFFGLKLTFTRDSEGRLLALKFTSANANDREIFREINQDIYGIIVADAGYVSKQLEQDMNVDKKRWVLIRPFKTMKKMMTP